MNLLDKNFKEIFSGQVISNLGGLIAGLGIAIYTDKILLIPGMFVLLPGFLELRGNISGTLSSRLSSGFFVGAIKSDSMNSIIVKANVIASFLLVMIVSYFLGLLAYFFNFFVNHVSTPRIIWIPLIAGIIANLVEIPLTLFLTFYLYKKGHDPNNIMGPFITSSGDITSVAAILIALWVI